MKNCLVYAVLFYSLASDALLLPQNYGTSSCYSLMLKNGKVKRRQRGRFVKFVCNTGYMLAGERFSTCAYGKWDPAPPRCVRPTCINKVTPPTNGLIYPTHSGAALHIYCKPGFQLKGPADVFCDGRKWDNNMPVCLATNSKPKLFCDFEDEDICGWSHDLNHDFDWRRENYQTPSGSIGTGPSYDHTKGFGEDGYYMYIESSSRNENDTARLISPIFDKTTTETCLEFFYHMYGATTGTLRVYLKKESQSWELHPSDAIFNKKGNQGDRWYRSYHSLGVIGEDYQIVIEGVRGPGYVSDIAVDDVKIIPDCVYEEITTTTDLPYSTEALLTVESCDGRCGAKALENETSQITCDCDDACYENNRCCPDYFDYCVSGTTDADMSTTNLVQELFTTTSMRVAKTTSKLLVVTSTTKLPTTPTTTRAPTTSKLPTTPKPPTTKRVYVPQPTIRLVPQPTIRLLPQPTLPVVVRKILPTLAPTPKVIYVKPPQKTPTDDSNETNDVIEVPRPTNNDEELLITPTIPVKVDLKENWPRDRLDGPFVGNFSEKGKFLSVTAPKSVGYNVVLVVITALGLSVLTTVIVVFVVRKYRGRHKRMMSANGDSQSDVRFLTGDEVLDFSLDKEYDSL